MNKSLKKKIDFMPLIILIFSAGYLIGKYLNGDILFMWRHFVGFFMLFVTIVIFFINHKLGVLCLGFTILLGLFGLLSFSPEIQTAWIGKSIGGENITFIYFQPIFILWAIIHFVLSWRYYIGVANANYWKDIKSDEPFKIQ